MLRVAPASPKPEGSDRGETLRTAARVKSMVGDVVEGAIFLEILRSSWVVALVFDGYTILFDKIGLTFSQLELVTFVFSSP